MASCGHNGHKYAKENHHHNDYWMDDSLIPGEYIPPPPYTGELFEFGELVGSATITYVGDGSTTDLTAPLWGDGSRLTPRRKTYGCFVGNCSQRYKLHNHGGG